MARRVGDNSALAYALSARRQALWEPENIEDRLSAADEILRLAGEAGDKGLSMSTLTWHLGDLLELGDMAGVDADIERRARLAEELRQPAYQVLEMLPRVMRALLEGRHDDGQRLAAEAYNMWPCVSKRQTST